MVGYSAVATAALLVAPGFHSDGFAPNVVPNVVPATSLFTPAVPADGLLGAAVGGAARDDNDDEDLTLDLVAEYRAGRVALALSALVRARSRGGVTVLWQTHVTTRADQISQRSAGLAAARAN